MSVNRILLATAMLLLASMLAGTAHPEAADQRVPVLVELFTSEGCSSCPPADALLADLDHQPVPGAEVIALGEHVDYWNELGWKDRFSSAQFTQRQSRYAARFRLGSVYTPEMVINGRTEFVGNDISRATNSIAAETRRSTTAPGIVISVSENNVDVDVTRAGPHRLDVMLAVTESGLSTQVGKGENHGRLLRHTAVVRDLRKIGTTAEGKFAARPQLTLPPEWHRDQLRAVVFLQDPSTLAITGAAQAAWK